MFSSTRAIQVLRYCCGVCEDKGRTWGHLLIYKLFKNYFNFIEESTELSSESSYAQKEGQSGTEESEKKVLLAGAISSGYFNRLKKPSWCK